MEFGLKDGRVHVNVQGGAAGFEEHDVLNVLLEIVVGLDHHFGKRRHCFLICISVLSDLEYL